MKKKIFTLLFAFAVGVLTMSAEVFSGVFGDEGNHTWSVNTEDSTFTITGVGDVPGYYWAQYVPWNDYRSYIKYVTLSYGLTGIPPFAFSGCPISQITIPGSVIGIGSYAFSGCTSLTSIVIPNGVKSLGAYAFDGCTKLKTVILPNGLEELGIGTFMECHSLENITIPAGIETISNGTFSDCFSLTSIVVPDGVTFIAEDAFLRVPNVIYHGSAQGASWKWQARSLNGYVDGYCVYNSSKEDTLLACSAAASGELHLSDSLRYISKEALYMCKSLTMLEIPAGVNYIGENAVCGCDSLHSVSCWAQTPPTLSNYRVFSPVDIILRVPMQSILLYKYDKLTYENGWWGDFKYIRGLPSLVNGIQCDRAIYIDAPCTISPSVGDTKWYYSEFPEVKSGTCVQITITNLTDQTNHVELSCLQDSCTGGSLLNIAKDLGPNEFHRIYLFDNGYYASDPLQHIVYLSCLGQMEYEISFNYVKESTIRAFGFEADNRLPEQIDEENLIKNLVNMTVTATPNNNYKHTISLINGGEGSFTMGGVVFSFTHEEAGKIAYKTYDNYIQPNGTNREIRIPTQTGEQVKVVLVEACNDILVNGVSTNFVAGENILTSQNGHIILTNPTEKPKISAIVPYNNTPVVPTYYTVTFKDWDGTVLKSEQVEEGQAATAPADPSRNGYTFTGWDTDFSNVIANLMVTAMYQKDTQTGIEDFQLSNISAPRKILMDNGQILILRGDRAYTLTGQEVR